MNSIISWGLSNPSSVFVIGLIISIALATDEKRIPIAQNVSLAAIILAASTIFLFYARGGFEILIVQVAGAVMGGIITAFIITKFEVFS